MNSRWGNLAVPLVVIGLLLLGVAFLATTTSAASEVAAPVWAAVRAPLTATVVPTMCATSEPQPWRTSVPQPAARYRSGAASDGEHVYAFGGGHWNPTVYRSDTWRFDPSTETWTQMADMPNGKQNIQGSLWNGKIYVPGGYNGQYLSELAIYDIAGDTWSLGTPMSGARGGAATAAYDGKIYVFGGATPTSYTSSSVEVYDIATDTWSSGPSLPIALASGRAVTAGEDIYYVGGFGLYFGSNSSVPYLYRLNPATNSWDQMASMHSPRSSAEVATDGQYIYAINGANGIYQYDAMPQTQTLEIYSITTNTWTYGYPVVRSASSSAGGMAGGKLVILGGIDALYNQIFNTVQVSTIPLGPCPTPGTPMTRTPTPTTTATRTATLTRTATASRTVTATRTTTSTRTATNTPLPTNTPGTPTPTVCISGPIVVGGSIDQSDAVQNGRLNRDAVADTCSTPGSCGPPVLGSFHYDTYTYTNTGTSMVCVTVNVSTPCAGNNFIYSGAYLGSFDPNNSCANWLADLGLSPDGAPEEYSFNVPGGATVVINVHEVVSNEGCDTYTLTITGLPDTCPTSTPEPPTSTAVATDTPAIATNSPTLEATSTAPATVSPTVDPDVSPTSTVETTPTAEATATPTSTSTSESTPTLQAGCILQFSDVPEESTFYPYVRCMACMNILNGYPDGTFLPTMDITRGQLAKILSNVAGFSDGVTGQTFSDVATNSTFWMYIERLAARGIIGGYPCGGPDEPCDADQRPYFRVNTVATRGQIAKIVSMAAQLNDPVTEQVFEDVPSSSVFFEYVGQIYEHDVIGGYSCGGLGEPCIAPLHRPYFRPGSNATRGQVAKIATLTFYPNCQTP